MLAWAIPRKEEENEVNKRSEVTSKMANSAGTAEEKSTNGKSIRTFLVLPTAQADFKKQNLLLTISHARVLNRDV